MNRFKTFMLFTVYPLAFFFLYAILFREIEDYAKSTFSLVPLRFFEILVPIVYGFTIGIIRNQKCTCGKLLWQSIYLLAAIGIILFGEIHVTLHRYMDVFSGFPILAITIGIYLYDLIYLQIDKSRKRK